MHTTINIILFVSLRKQFKFNNSLFLFLFIILFFSFFFLVHSKAVSSSLFYSTHYYMRNMYADPKWTTLCTTISSTIHFSYAYIVPHRTLYCTYMYVCNERIIATTMNSMPACVGKVTEKERNFYCYIQ